MVTVKMGEGIYNFPNFRRDMYSKAEQQLRMKKADRLWLERFMQYSCICQSAVQG
jgi:hypothetical protein